MTFTSGQLANAEPAAAEAKLKISKTVSTSGPVSAGDQVTFEVIVNNSSPDPISGDLKDWIAKLPFNTDFSTDTRLSVSNSNFFTATYTNGEFIDIHYDLPPHGFGTISYTVTVKDYNPDAWVSSQVMFPDGQPNVQGAYNRCIPGDKTCAEFSIEALLQVQKTVNVEEGTIPVSPGTVLRYSIYFNNNSATEAQINHVDHLASVLAGADLVKIEDNEFVDLKFDETAQTLSMSGAIDPGNSVSVDYLVKVKEDFPGDRLINYVTGPDYDGAVPPQFCRSIYDSSMGFDLRDLKKPDEDCVIVDVHQVEVSKQVRSLGEDTLPGAVLEYRIELKNQTPLSSWVMFQDDLSDVLAHGELVANPMTDAPAGEVTVEDNGLAGSVLIQPESSVVITYQVQTNPETEIGTTLTNCVDGDIYYDPGIESNPETFHPFAPGRSRSVPGEDPVTPGSPLAQVCAAITLEATPEEPEEPETPEEPEEPETPEQPDEPETPEQPDEPKQPKAPSQPAKPVAPPSTGN